MVQSKDLWICYEKIINAQNYSDLETTWGAHLQHRRLADDDLS